MARFYFDHALLEEGWSDDVLIDVDDAGRITAITSGEDVGAIDFRGGVAVPGMPNLHSHAFQRAMAGLTEVRGDGQDSFWTWRQIMYRFVETISPGDLLAIANLLYVEMLESGFTSVAEFHYTHHQPDGRPYPDIGEMAGAITAAAETSGIGLTLLPVFYANCGFGGQPPEEGQKRFISTPESFSKLHDRCRDIVSCLPNAETGIAPHSLRAVTPESLSAVVPLAGKAPIHIHIAEQMKEVAECVQWSGRRPVEWLLDHHDVDRQWCLVHATHLTGRECENLAASNAVAGLCPVTEANLGDGIFDGVRYRESGGALGIGSDSNVMISPAEELRLLEYSQRFRDQGRNLMADAGSTGGALFRAALAGGAQACGRGIGKLKTGYRADIVSLDTNHAAMISRQGDLWLDSWIFTGGNDVVKDVWTGGRHVVKDGTHINRHQAVPSFNSCIKRILTA